MLSTLLGQLLVARPRRPLASQHGVLESGVAEAHLAEFLMACRDPHSPSDGAAPHARAGPGCGARCHAGCVGAEHYRGMTRGEGGSEVPFSAGLSAKTAGSWSVTSMPAF